MITYFIQHIYLTQHLKASWLATSDQFAPGKDLHNALVKAQKVNVTGIAPELRNENLRLWDELSNVAHDAQRVQMTKCDGTQPVSSASLTPSTLTYEQSLECYNGMIIPLGLRRLMICSTAPAMLSPRSWMSSPCTPEGSLEGWFIRELYTQIS